jgi:hypothetical protein
MVATKQREGICKEEQHYDIGEWMKKNNMKDTIMVVQWTPSFVDVSMAGDLRICNWAF